MLLTVNTTCTQVWYRFCSRRKNKYVLHSYGISLQLGMLSGHCCATPLCPHSICCSRLDPRADQLKNYCDLQSHFSCTISNYQFYLTSWYNERCETSPSVLQPHITHMYTHSQPQHPPSQCLLLPLICSSPPSNLSQYFSVFLLISSGAAITLIKAKPLALEQLCSVIIEWANHTACSHNKHNISTFLWQPSDMSDDMSPIENAKITIQNSTI